MILAESLSDNVTLGGINSETLSNAPYTIAAKLCFMGLLGLFMTVAITNAAALRDFDARFDQILFTTPITKKGYIFGRFASSVLLSLLPMIGVMFAIQLASSLLPAEEVVASSLGSYLRAFLLFT